MPFFFDGFQGRDGGGRKFAGDDRALKKAFFETVGDMGHLVDQLMLAGVIFLCLRFVVAEDHLACFPVVGKFHITGFAVDGCAVLEKRYGTIFQAEQNTIFHPAGDHILLFYIGSGVLTMVTGLPLMMSRT